MPDVLAAARAEALFVSSVQSSETPPEALFVSSVQSSETPPDGVVRRAVAEAFSRLGSLGCAAGVAGEFGDHPEVAVPRMRWAIATVDAVYSRTPAAARALTAAACAH
jgi:hypothetical protein